MYQEILNAAGLSQKEAEIYEILLSEGELTAGKLHKKTPYKRSLVYKALDELIDKGLILKLDAPGKVATFRIEHPIKIKERLEDKAKKLNYYQKSAEEMLPQLISSYNLAFNKPGIKFYEGEEGLIKVLENTLASKSDIYLFINPKVIFENENIKEINEEYKKKRERAGIRKKIIRLGPPPELTFGRANDRYDAITEIRYMEEKSFPFVSSIQIYDGKISYQLMEKNNIISILIHSQHIYEMHRTWFDFCWKKLEKK